MAAEDARVGATDIAMLQGSATNFDFRFNVSRSAEMREIRRSYESSSTKPPSPHAGGATQRAKDAGFEPMVAEG
jgi:hypothetical protein